MNNDEIRSIFYSFFADKGHHKVLSSPLVPAKDPTIMFTNAGMNQFKDVFLQREKREYSRAVSIQKCMRVSGKHNDFNEVGKTEYHHTFFEMMGNFSFGGYFKEGAIEYAWELLTHRYQFDPQRLWISVFKDDDEAHEIWENRIGVPPEKIARLGDKDNFWQMGETGPCGPCSEIHFDRGEAFGPGEVRDGNDRFVEIWNLVFMQYYRDEKGDLSPLPAPSIDTGMGIERLTTLLQGKESNYQTDLFSPIIDFVAEQASVSISDRKHMVDIKVIADHTRALTFLISDGVLPANDGRGYVLRRLLRRAAKHGRALDLNEPFLHKVSSRAVDVMKAFYPELEYNRDFISQVILAEEERFNRTLLNGLKHFEDYLLEAESAGTKQIPGNKLFKLSDTYGFPLDFAADLANEKDIGVDVEGFNRELEHQRNQSRKDLAAKKKSRISFEDIEKFDTAFTGYEHLQSESTLLAIYSADASGTHYRKIPGTKEGKKDRSDTEMILVFDQTPFYAESGGQVGDRGHATNDEAYLEVTDTQKAPSGAFLHSARLKRGDIEVDDKFLLAVDGAARQDTAVHHSATHLLHYALREVLGLHVKQAGSYVGPDKLRFDFTHFQPLSEDELKNVEEIVNRQIRKNLRIFSRDMQYEEAVQGGAIALFEEKYSDAVRVISMGDVSKELCGGTHLETSGEIGSFMIVSESSIASGVRRVEALGGESCYLYIRDNLKTLSQLQHHFHQSADAILPHLLQLENSLKEKEKEIKKTRPREKPVEFNKIVDRAAAIEDIRTVVEFLEEIDRTRLGSLADEVKEKIEGISVLFSNINGKSAIILSVPGELTTRLHAGTVIKEIARLVDGKGGGRADFAQAGGDPITDIPKIKKEYYPDIGEAPEMKGTAVLLFVLMLAVPLIPEIVVKQDKNGKIVVSNRTSRAAARTKTIRSKKPSGVSTIPSAYRDKIRTLSQKHELREDLIIAVAQAESSFNPYAVSRKGAIGIMQLMIDTAKKYGVANRFNVDQNLEGGIKHLKYLYKKYNSNLPLTLAAYNAGETAVKKYGGVPPYTETQQYIKRVMGTMGMGYSSAIKTKLRTKLYKYTTHNGRVIITDRLPAKIDGRIEVLD